MPKGAATGSCAPASSAPLPVVEGLTRIRAQSRLAFAHQDWPWENPDYFFICANHGRTYSSGNCGMSTLLLIAQATGCWCSGR